MEKFFFFVHSSKRKKDFKSITIKYEKKAIENERDIYGKPGNVKYIISNVWLKERKN